MGEKRNAYSILLPKPEWKRPLGRPRRRWKDNIRIDLCETVGSCGLVSSDLRPGPVAGPCEHDNEPVL
jgi:hypothetical protein